MPVQPFEASATYQDLQRFLAEPGCAVCQAMAQAERRYFDALLYENVLSPPVHLRLRASNGFCGRHLETLVALRDPMATAILYAGVLDERRHLLARWRHGNRSIARTAAAAGQLTAIGLQCPACEAEDEAAKRVCEVLAAGLDTGSLRADWQRSAALCWPHFAQTRVLCHAGRRVLEDHEAEVLDRLAADVDTLVRSFDYRWQGVRTSAVEAAWRQVVATVAGRFQGGLPHPPHPQPPRDRLRDGGQGGVR